MKKLNYIIWLIILGTFSSVTSAALLDFNDFDNLGVERGGVTMKWSDIGGGHLWSDDALEDDYISFSTPTYVNSFKMNALPYQGFDSDRDVIGSIDIEGLNAAEETLWTRTVDLTKFTNWNNWFTVKIEEADTTTINFKGPGFEPHFNKFWPSIDDMVINEQMPQVPVPAAIWLFISGLAGIFGTGLSRRLSK